MMYQLSVGMKIVRWIQVRRYRLTVWGVHTVSYFVVRPTNSWSTRYSTDSTVCMYVPGSYDVAIISILLGRGEVSKA